MFQEIVPPTNCPSCDSPLVWVDPQLFCTSSTCGEQAFKAVEHFAKTMKIKGLGPSSIRKLGWSCPSDIYLADEETVSSTLSSEKVASKLLAEIGNSVAAPLELLLPAFGIPLIGNTATRKLSETVKHISEINADTCERAGLGPKASSNLLDWIENELPYFMEVMPHSWVFSSTKPTATTKGVVCISGRLKSFKTKAEATTALNQAGYEVKSSITKDVAFLINESGQESSKTTDARIKGIEIITNLTSFLEN